jgi:hypothetical protein
MSSSQRAKKSILFLVVVNFALLVQSGMMAEDLKNANKNILYARTMRSDLGALRLAVLSVVLDRLILQNKQSTDVGLEIKHYSEKLSIDLLELRGGFKGDKNLSAKVDEITQAAQAYNTACRTQMYPRIATSQFEEIRAIGEQLRPNYEKAMNLSEELANDALRASKERAQLDKAIFLSGASIAVILSLIAYFSVPKN